MYLNKAFVGAAVGVALALSVTPASAQHRGGGGSRPSGGHVGAVRPTVGPRTGAAPRGIVGSRFNGGRVYAYGGRYRYASPYYSFRPRLSLGFGLWMGYAVPYPYYYGDPYGYSYPYPSDPYAYGDAAPSYRAPDDGPADQGYAVQPSTPSARGSTSAQPAARGGVSFQITPDTAAVFVDGTFVGTASTFGPTSQPLGLVPGRHHLEVRAAGFQTMTFDATVTSGQVIPYQGTMQRN